MRLKLPVTAVGACALAVSATACGERVEPTVPRSSEQVTVTLAGRPSSTDLCLYQAKATGAFEQAGLSVTLAVPKSPAAPFEMLDNGRADLIVAAPKDLLIRRDGGAPFISVARLTTTSIDQDAKPSHRPHKGKGHVGQPVGPQVLVATRETVSNRGSLVRRLLQAAGRACSGNAITLRQGESELLAASRANRSAPEATPTGGPPMTRPPSGKPWGWQPPAEWAALLFRLRKSGDVKVPTPSDTSYTNEFLAGQGA